MDDVALAREFMDAGGDAQVADDLDAVDLLHDLRQHGDIARACGYCDAIKYYQTPAARWMKTYEDRAFRWLIGTHGTPLDIPNVCQIRHIVKGRYKKDSWWTKVRKAVRMSQDT